MNNQIFGNYESRLEFVKSAWLARNQIYEDLFGQTSYTIPSIYEPPKLTKKIEVNFKDFNSGQLNSNGQPKSKPSSIIDSYLSGDIFEEQELTVLAYAPDPLRPYWLYVTAGLSTPWLQTEPAEVSGYGLELAIKSPGDAKWANQILRTLAFYIIQHTGILSPGATLALNGPIDAYSNSLIRDLLIWYLDEAPDAWYELPSGGFGLFSCIGITDAEMSYTSKQPNYGAWCMQEILRRLGHKQITYPMRNCVMKDKNIKKLKQEVKEYAKNFNEFSSKLQVEDAQ